MDLFAISVSRDQKWVVCGTMKGASVWDTELSEKVAEVEGTSSVCSVDVAPDCTRFATGLTGMRGFGPLRLGVDWLAHSNTVVVSREPHSPIREWIEYVSRLTIPKLIIHLVLKLPPWFPGGEDIDREQARQYIETIFKHATQKEVK